MTGPLLDTNVCVDLIRDRSASLKNRLASYPPEAVAISTITLAELQHGAEKSVKSHQARSALREFCVWLEILPFDSDCAVEYGRIRAELERKGTVIGPMDMLIAAHALAAGRTLITGNLREFQRVRGLLIESW